jgi:stage III sporulation protein AB
LKTIILIALAGVCTAIGVYFRAGIYRRVLILREIRYMLDEIVMLIRFRGATVGEITETLCEDKRLCDLTFLGAVSENCKNGESFSDCWANAVSGFRQNGLTESDIKLIENIGKNLGTTDIEGQIASLSLYQSEVNTAFAAAEEQTGKKAKLYTSLGILAGAFLLVFLI